MNSMRRLGNGLVLDKEKSSGIKLFDAVKAREMLARRSSQESGIIASEEKRTNKSTFARKGMNFIKDSSLISSTHKPSVNNLLSPNSQVKRHAFK